MGTAYINPYIASSLTIAGLSLTITNSLFLNGLIPNDIFSISVDIHDQKGELILGHWNTTKWSSEDNFTWTGYNHVYSLQFDYINFGTTELPTD